VIKNQTLGQSGLFYWVYRSSQKCSYTWRCCCNCTAVAGVAAERHCLWAAR